MYIVQLGVQIFGKTGVVPLRWELVNLFVYTESSLVDKKLVYQDLKYSNKSALASSLVSVCLFGDTSQRLTQKQRERTDSLLSIQFRPHLLVGSLKRATFHFCNFYNFYKFFSFLSFLSFFFSFLLFCYSLPQCVFLKLE